MPIYAAHIVDILQNKHKKNKLNEIISLVLCSGYMEFILVLYV